MARILFCSWRDAEHPQAGGAETYLHRVARELVAVGHEVVIATSRPRGASSVSEIDGVTVHRHGGTITVYPHVWLRLACGRWGRFDRVVDVQNGVPFFARLATTARTVVLVHHVHREQWGVVLPGLRGRIGWWIESRLAPFLHRGVKHVTVSAGSAADLVRLGVSQEDVHVVRNGADADVVPSISSTATSAEPGSPVTLCVVGRLVPHKRVEHAIDVLAALIECHPHLMLDVVGDGWWRARLVEHAAARGVSSRVRFHGHLSTHERDRTMAVATALLLPSLKEGWGLVVTEAGAQGTPAIAYREAGGTQESIDDGRTGVLVDDLASMTAATDALLSDPGRREALGRAARRKAAAMSWTETARQLAQVLDVPDARWPAARCEEVAA